MNWNDYSIWVTHPAIQALIISAAGILLAYAFDLIVGRLVSRLVKRTATEVDDAVVHAVRPAVKQSIMIIALWSAIRHLEPGDVVMYVATGILSSWGILVWVLCSFRVAETVLGWLSRHRDRFHAVNARTLPIFEMLAKGALIGAGFYFLFLAWQVDITGWLASAGILGVVLGFGAKDTVADLFAGVFILAEAPYKRGDYLLLASGERGRVTRIGVRTTRILTPDEVEIIIPNSRMATTQICNESGGPHEIERVNVNVNVAYGTDMDAVRSTLLEVAATVPGVIQDDHLHTSSVQFCAMGDSGLELQLRVWIARPDLRLSVIDAMNDKIYKRLQADGFEIPYPKRDVYLHQDKG